MKNIKITVTEVSKDGKKSRELITYLADEEQVLVDDYGIKDLSPEQRFKAEMAAKLMFVELINGFVEPEAQEIIQTECECPKCKPRN